MQAPTDLHIQRAAVFQEVYATAMSLIALTIDDREMLAAVAAWQAVLGPRPVVIARYMDCSRHTIARYMPRAARVFAPLIEAEQGA